MKPQGEYVEVDRLKTFYVKSGSGHPLVLMHGGSPGASALVSWKLNIEPLAMAGFTVYAYDQPGYGYTDNPDDYSVEYRVNHAKAFLGALRLDRFHLIGNSQGGYIAARVALQDQRTQGLVLVASGTLAPPGSGESVQLAKKHAEELQAYTPSIENMRALTMGTLFRSDLVTDEFVKERYEMSTGKNFASQQARWKTRGARPIHEELGNIKCKTLILWGNNDRGAAVERAGLLFKRIPNAELHVFDRCAHWVQWDQANRFNQIVADFLGRH